MLRRQRSQRRRERAIGYALQRTFVRTLLVVATLSALRSPIYAHVVAGCQDTPDWEDFHGKDCKAYDLYWCKGGTKSLNFRLGYTYNWPESNCCQCHGLGPGTWNWNTKGNKCPSLHIWPTDEQMSSDVCPHNLYGRPMPRSTHLGPNSSLRRSAERDVALLMRVRVQLDGLRRRRRRHFEEGYGKLKEMLNVQVTDALTFRETWGDDDTEVLRRLDPYFNGFVRHGKLETNAFAKRLPSMEEFNRWIEKHSHAAIVGSAGSLHDSSKGKEIDGHDEVVRFNDLIPHRTSMDPKDLGKRTTVHVECSKVRPLGDEHIIEFDLESFTPWRSYCHRLHSGGLFADIRRGMLFLFRPSALCSMGDKMKEFTRGFLFYWFVGRLYKHVDMYGFSGSTHYDAKAPSIHEQFLNFEHLVYRTQAALDQEIAEKLKEKKLEAKRKEDEKIEALKRKAEKKEAEKIKKIIERKREEAEANRQRLKRLIEAKLEAKREDAQQVEDAKEQKLETTKLEVSVISHLGMAGSLPCIGFALAACVAFSRLTAPSDPDARYQNRQRGLVEPASSMPSPRSPTGKQEPARVIQGQRANLSQSQREMALAAYQDRQAPPNFKSENSGFSVRLFSSDEQPLLAPSLQQALPSPSFDSSRGSDASSSFYSGPGRPPDERSALPFFTRPLEPARSFDSGRSLENARLDSARAQQKVSTAGLWLAAVNAPSAAPYQHKSYNDDRSNARVQRVPNSRVSVSDELTW